MILTFTYSDLENLIKRAVSENTTDLSYLIRTENDLAFKIVDCKEAVNASAKINECGLSNRAVNCIQHYVAREASNGNITKLLAKTDEDIKEFVATMTVSDVVSCIPSLINIKGCGKETAKEITYKFEALGVVVNKWKDELSHWYKVGAGV